MPLRIQATGLEPLIQRFRAFPYMYMKFIKQVLLTSLLVIWENVLPYPPQWPGGWYKRTGLLGRTMGSSEEGGKKGKPDIFEVRLKSRMSEAKFGSRLGYAPDVIGENQDPFFSGRGWWTIVEIAHRSRKKIERLFKIMAEEMARFLDGRGAL